MGGPTRLKIPGRQYGQKDSPSSFGPKWPAKRLLNDLLSSTATFLAFETVSDTKFADFRLPETLKIKHVHLEGRHF